MDSKRRSERQQRERNAQNGNYQAGDHHDRSLVGLRDRSGHRIPMPTTCTAGGLEGPVARRLVHHPHEVNLASQAFRLSRSG